MKLLAFRKAATKTEGKDMLMETSSIAGSRRKKSGDHKPKSRNLRTKANQPRPRPMRAATRTDRPDSKTNDDNHADSQRKVSRAESLVAKLKAKQKDAAEKPYRLGKKAEDVFFCPPNHYLVPDNRGVWIRASRSDAADYLTEHHGHGRKSADGELSPVDSELLRIRYEQNVDYADSLAGYGKGYLPDLNGKRVLVTVGPKITEPKEGDWSVVRQIIHGLLADANHDQAVYFHGWLRDSYTCLVSKKWRPGQILGLVGPRNIGKSLLQTIITAITGGRDTSPYMYFAGRTNFNGELFTAEHLKIEDEAASTDIRARRQLGNYLKQIAANRRHKLHDKYNRGIDLPVLWRCSITMNDEAENVLILPPMDESLVDKFILLKCSAFPLPMQTDTPEQEEVFWGVIQEQLPHYLHWLTTEFVLPEDLKSNRFSVKHFHHPDIIQALNELSPEEKLLQLIDTMASEVFAGELRRWEGKAVELEALLTANDSKVQYEARRLLFTQARCGQYLARLAKRYPDRVQEAKRVHHTVIWSISPEQPFANAQQTTSWHGTARAVRSKEYGLPEV